MTKMVPLLIHFINRQPLLIISISYFAAKQTNRQMHATNYQTSFCGGNKLVVMEAKVMMNIDERFSGISMCKSCVMLGP